MNVTPTSLPDVLVLEPKIFQDERGFFFESYNARKFEEETGCSPQFVQDNHSRSVRHTLRGLHYQIKQPQGKLVRVIVGEIFDVAVDLRKSSPTFGQWTGCRLSAENKAQMWVPVGFAHGFLVLSEVAEVLYKTTDFYAPQHERSLLWNDTKVGVEWPLSDCPILSQKDKQGLSLDDVPLFD
ncbi:dTDP-4-dehydrorhamnose 3,5-epimerase [Spirulina sp. CS-785/01]|uniref:dTDP-4-dehydrorhamnose 3,5-epimerase n=1 Tax=Spirulina sp. CS-785/01 TaxID=3021716 RepID=UPI002330A99D|nr:dTDP-4-dehydrorhamnose 3,5-epimerase [Spirulina sp. CS-785/01]MDB9313748.1 dTDP-4-dehydrorhamnose 3,5-epimerase [Spirulina sp. CS-785/01]